MFKRLFCWVIFGGAYFRRGLLLEGTLRFKMSWAWQENSLKQLKTVHGLILGSLVIGGIFASEIWGDNFREGLFLFCFVLFFGGEGRGGLLSEFYVISAVLPSSRYTSDTYTFFAHHKPPTLISPTPAHSVDCRPLSRLRSQYKQRWRPFRSSRAIMAILRKIEDCKQSMPSLTCVPWWRVSCWVH